MRITLALLLSFLVLLGGCSDSRVSQFKELHGQVQDDLVRLESSLENNNLRNGRLLHEYAKILKASKPELAGLVRELEKDATPKGPVFESLKRRLYDTEQVIQSDLIKTEALNEGFQELQAIRSAAKPDIFNDALSDTINVLADMSNGQLKRVNSLSKEAEKLSDSTTRQRPGRQLIGNPHYGSWSNNAGGSFWVWYGQYRFFSSVFGSRPYYYNDWSGSRGYSYYHDVGRRSYTSPKERAAQGQVEQRARKNYKSSKPFTSPYAKKRRGASQLSKASMSQTNAVFKSPYSNASKGKFQSSARNSSNRTSRGSARGK